MTHKDYSLILITGALSGIGQAVAPAEAAPGLALVLLGRGPDRIGEVVEECRGHGARVAEAIIHVRDRDAKAT